MDFRHSPTGGIQTWRKIEEITPPGATEAEWYQQKMREIGTKAFVTMTCGHECRIVPRGGFDEKGRPIGHDIAADGTLSPSLQCMVEGCAFHEGGCVLKDWKG